MCVESAEFLNVTADGIYSYHRALKGQHIINKT